MSETPAREIFAKNLSYFMALNDKRQSDLAKYIGSSTGLISAWCRGEKMPRVDKIKSICDWFGIEMSDLLTDKSREQEAGAYLSSKAKRIANEICGNPDLYALFELCVEMPPERVRVIRDFLKNLQETENK